MLEKNLDENFDEFCELIKRVEWNDQFYPTKNGADWVTIQAGPFSVDIDVNKAFPALVLAARDLHFVGQVKIVFNSWEVRYYEEIGDPNPNKYEKFTIWEFNEDGSYQFVESRMGYVIYGTPAYFAACTGN